jgi:molybdopterin synthase catalytic subunit
MVDVMVELTESTIDTDLVLKSVISPECGAALLFVGSTRQWTDQLETSFLEYDAYRSMALLEMQKLVEEAKERWGVKEVRVVHRLGRVEIGEVSIAIAVSSPHRAEAFEAGQWLIDEFKQRVPIWKKEHWKTAGEQWIHPLTSNDCRSDSADGNEVAHGNRNQFVNNSLSLDHTKINNLVKPLSSSDALDSSETKLGS